MATSVKTLKQQTGLSLYELVNLCKLLAVGQISFEEFKTIRTKAKEKQSSQLKPQ